MINIQEKKKMANYAAAYIPAPFTSTAAPKLPDYYPEPEVKSGRKAQTKTRQKENKKALVEQAKKICVTFVLSCVAFAMLAAIIMMNNRIIENDKVIASLNSNIAQASAENVRLKTSMEASISADKVQDYAVSVLGMQKAERYQIHYFEDRDGDKVVITNGKALNADRQG